MEFRSGPGVERLAVESSNKTSCSTDTGGGEPFSHENTTRGFHLELGKVRERLGDMNGARRAYGAGVRHGDLRNRKRLRALDE